MHRMAMLFGGLPQNAVLNLAKPLEQLALPGPHAQLGC